MINAQDYTVVWKKQKLNQDKFQESVVYDESHDNKTFYLYFWELEGGRVNNDDAYRALAHYPISSLSAGDDALTSGFLLSTDFPIIPGGPGGSTHMAHCERILESLQNLKTWKLTSDADSITVGPWPKLTAWFKFWMIDIWE